MKKLLLIALCLSILTLTACDFDWLLEDDEPVSTTAPAAGNSGNPDGEQGSSDNGFYLPEEFDFTATDIYGNAVTGETLGEKQVFFVHLWATWCPPCINEMPDLAQLALDYGDKVGFIGLLDDYDSNLDGAISIVESAGVPDSFVTLDANDDSVAPLLEAVKSGYFPTTVLITSDGLSEQIVGAKGSKYVEYLDEIVT